MNDASVNRNQPRIPSTALLPGAIILLIGVGILLSNFGLLQVPIGKLWPLVLILIGVVNMLKRRMDAMIWGLTLAIWGGGFLMGNFGLLSFPAWKLWPIFMLSAGAQLLWGGLAAPRRGGSWCGGGRSAAEPDWPKRPAPAVLPASSQPGSADSSGPVGPNPSAGEAESWLHMMAVFAESRRRVVSPALVRGEAWSVFGNCDLDLRFMGVPDHPVTIDANTIFGAIEIHVPGNWDVALRGTGMFGVYEDKTVSAPPDGKARGQLIVTGLSAFGAITVRN